MLYTIPLLDDKRLNNNEKLFIGMLWVLSSHNANEAFFQKEHIDLIGGRQIYNRTTKRLKDRNIIDFQVKGYGTLKHRYFTIIDPEIIKEFKNTSKTLTEQKRSKSGTDIPSTDPKSILVNSDSDLNDIFYTAIDQLKQDGKIIPLSLNLTLEICNFKEFYNGRKISVDTVCKWLLKAI